jgi:hypothetical protein
MNASFSISSEEEISVSTSEDPLDGISLIFYLLLFIFFFCTLPTF